jgi:hypothetical protein
MDGGPLSSTFEDGRHDETRRETLYRSISQILLDLAKVPPPRIGSWKMDGRGVISLTNRPLLDLTMLWNRHEIPTGVPRVRCSSRPCMIVLTLSPPFAGLDVYLRRCFRQRPPFLSRPSTSPSAQFHTRQARWHFPTLCSHCAKSPVPKVLQPKLAQ